MNHNWHSLTWATLEDWAGLRCVERGRQYCRGGRVTWLGMSEAGEVVARVCGTTRYACRVRLEGDQLLGRCTCPFDGPGCKHSVAAVLAYMDALRSGREVQPADDAVVGWQFPSLDDAVLPASLPDSIEALREAIDRTLVWPLPSACEETLPLLRRLRTLLVAAGCEGEWQAYEARLRAKHWRQPRMNEVLDRVTSRPVIPVTVTVRATGGSALCGTV